MTMTIEKLEILAEIETDRGLEIDEIEERDRLETVARFEARDLATELADREVAS